MVPPDSDPPSAEQSGLSGVKVYSIAVVIALVIAFVGSNYLDLSAKGAEAFTFLSIIFCVAIGAVIRRIFRSKKDEPSQ